MSTFTKLTGSAFALALLVGVGAPAVQADEHEKPDVIEALIAKDSGFEGLVGALSKVDDEPVNAGLTNTVATIDADITIFAPTNKAFDKIPSFLDRAIAADPALLVPILQYHVAPGALLAEDVVEERRIDTLLGDELRVRDVRNGVYLDRSKVVETDIELMNSAGSHVVVHRIDRVLVPWGDRTFRTALVEALFAHR